MVIGAVFLVMVVVLAVSVVGVFLFSQPPAQKIPSLNAMIWNDSKNIYVTHEGGDALSSGDFKIYVNGNDLTSSFNLSSAPGQPWSTWSIGNTLLAPIGTAPLSSVQVVYTGAGSSAVVIASSYPGGGTEITPVPTPIPAPIVTGSSPASGPVAGGTSVTISGMAFTGATAVMFGSTTATTYTVNNGTSITATSPAGSAGTVDITVTTPGGTSGTSSADYYTYAAVPTVTGISPASGPVAGGTSVTITGTGYTGVTAVKFGSTAAASYTVNSATSITATSPAGSAGTVDITVTTPGGTSGTSSADYYTYAAVPIVTGISPASGPVAGGTSVTITGTGFTGTTAVKFGSTAASSYTVNNATSIIATSPAGSAGTVDITVTTPGGTSGTSSADYYTYAAVPTVTGISPAAGATGGGTSVTITGTGFTGTTAVKFGSTAASSYTVNNATSIIATSPAGSAGTVDITVTTPGGTSGTSSADYYTYAAVPTVTGISPAAGATGGGTSVTITGTGFTGATAVKFGSTAATLFTVNSATQITATSPNYGSTGTVDITVTTPGGTSATSSADQFTFGNPTVTGISPASGPVAGGTSGNDNRDGLYRGDRSKVWQYGGSLVYGE